MTNHDDRDASWIPVLDASSTRADVDAAIEEWVGVALADVHAQLRGHAGHRWRATTDGRPGRADRPITDAGGARGRLATAPGRRGVSRRHDSLRAATRWAHARDVGLSRVHNPRGHPGRALLRGGDRREARRAPRSWRCSVTLARLTVAPACDLPRVTVAHHVQRVL